MRVRACKGVWSDNGQQWHGSLRAVWNLGQQDGRRASVERRSSRRKLQWQTHRLRHWRVAGALATKIPTVRRTHKCSLAYLMAYLLFLPERGHLFHD